MRGRYRSPSHVKSNALASSPPNLAPGPKCLRYKSLRYGLGRYQSKFQATNTLTPMAHRRSARRSGAVVEEIVDLARRFGADPGDLGEVGRRGALDRLERAEMLQERALAGRADAGDFLQAGLAD